LCNGLVAGGLCAKPLRRDVGNETALLIVNRFAFSLKGLCEQTVKLKEAGFGHNDESRAAINDEKD
jgi:hypothetical protein